MNKINTAIPLRIIAGSAETRNKIPRLKAIAEAAETGATSLQLAFFDASKKSAPWPNKTMNKTIAKPSTGPYKIAKNGMAMSAPPKPAYP